MSGALKINGTSSGSTTITAPASGGDETIELSTALAAKLDSADYTPGLSLITTQSFSAVSSVSVNNCFSGDYDNYRVLVLSNGSQSTQEAIYFRLRASGTDSSTGYNNTLIYATTGLAAGKSFSADTFGYVGYTANAATNYGPAVSEIMAPYASSSTAYTVHGGGYGGTSNGFMIGTGHQAVAASYDGITLYVGNGTFSGKIAVYGYGK